MSLHHFGHDRTWLPASARLGACVALALLLAACQAQSPVPVGARAPTPQPPVTASGFIEATDVNIVPEVSAQIVSLPFEEGDRVTAGQVIAQLDTALPQAQRQQAAAALAAAQAALNETLASPRPETVAAAQADLARAQANWLGARQAVTDTRSILYQPPGLAEQITQAQTQVKVAEQAVEQAQATLTDEGYLLALTNKGSTERAVEKEKNAALQANLAAAQAQLSGAQAYLAALQKVKQAPVDLIANVHAAQSQVQVSAATITMTQAALAVAQATAAPQEVAQARATVQVAAASLAAVDTQIAKYTLTSPLSGVVTHKLAHLGEVSLPGQSLLVVSDLGQLSLKVYVPETQIGRVSIEEPVAVSVDAYPEQSFPGVVGSISPQAEFTPSNIQTASDRTKLVFAVKILLPNAGGQLKPGMPADVVFQAP
jgi:HlyD family secretion protein